MSSHGVSDSGMQKTMIAVGIALCVITLLIIVASRILSSGSNDEFDQIMHDAQMKRIEPVSRVRTTAPAAVQVAAAAASAAPRSGEELSAGTCANCHNTGVAGAPAYTDKAAWDARAANGLEALVASVVNGKGAMPAGGGSDYTEAEIIRAVEFMTGLGNGGAVAEAAEETDSAVEQAGDSDSAASESEAANTESSAADSQTTESARENTDSAAAATDAASSSDASGVVAALTPRVQTAVDKGVCAACHASGVAGAPKYDDAAEWAKRAESGFAALAQSIQNGKGGMPPRGGSDLSDDELLMAVEYIVRNSQ